MRMIALMMMVFLFVPGSLFARDVTGLDKHVKKIANMIYDSLERGAGDDGIEKWVVIFMPFRIGSYHRTTRTGRHIVDEVCIALINKGVKVVDREAVYAALEERHLAEVGLINEFTTIEIGKALGANVYIQGRISLGYSYIGWNSRITPLKWGVSISGVSYSIDQTRRIKKFVQGLGNGPPNPNLTKSITVFYWRDENGKMQRRSEWQFKRK